MEAQLEAARVAGVLARERERCHVIHPQPHHAVRSDVDVAVDHRVDLPVREYGLGTQRRARSVGPADAHHDVRRAGRRRGRHVREMLLEVVRQLGVIGLDVEGDAADVDTHGTLGETHERARL